MDICLIYFSTSVELLQEEALVKLLQHSRSRNAEEGISGLLLYVRGQIIQALEEVSSRW